MRKEKYTLNEYYKYADTAQSIMKGWNKVNKTGILINGDGMGGSYKEEWVRMIAYHHWLNQDDLIFLFDRLGICKYQREQILNFEKRFKELQEDK